MNAQVLSLYKEGRYDKALPLAERVLSIREKALGPDNVLVASALRNLALVLWNKGRRKEAQATYERFLSTYEKAVGADSPKLVEAYDAYVCLLAIGGQKEEALKIERRLYKLENGFDYDRLFVDLPAPGYPAEAKLARITGPVVMKVTVDESGKVVGVNTLCGQPVLAEEAKKAISKARAKPVVVAGKPVKVNIIVTYNFAL